MDASQELVDIVDDTGKVIGTATRGEMRRQRLRHRCIYLLVFNQRGELFIHQRTAAKDIYPSYWDTAVGGVLAKGESFDEGVRRESREELGVELVPEFLFPFRYADALTDVFAQAYRAVHDGPFCLQPEEVVRGEFVAVADALARVESEPFCPDGLAVLQQYCFTQANRNA
jgi:isopentenyldiphosphate isomerase